MKRLLLILLFTACSNSEDGVKVYNSDPATSIIEPYNGAVYAEGDIINFIGKVDDDDPPQDLEIQWTSSIDGIIPDFDPPDNEGNVEVSIASLSEGTHVITLRAIDAKASQGEHEIRIDIEDVPDAPTIEIIHPSTDQSGIENVPFVFMASVSDYQDNPEDMTVTLSANPGGFICYLEVDGEGNSQCLATLPIGQYVLTFSAEDTNNNISYGMTTFQVLPEADVDQDGDGYTPNGGDCNDSNDTIYPGAPELCDGLDNDCDGDANDLVGSTCYDDDGDGFCEIPDCVNSSEGIPDCDDTNSNISPYGTEVLNGVDDNCDGRIDEGTNVYDDDGDGYCETPPCVNTSNMQADCDDNNYNVYPTATEICSDGVDNNCNGLDNEENAIGCNQFYYDNDGDTYGVSGPTECWCDNGVYPYTGLDTNDCYDNNAEVRPNQNQYFGIHRGDNTFDYDCNGAEEMESTQESLGCDWVFQPFSCEEEGQGWDGGAPNCGQTGYWIDDCDADINYFYLAICAGASYVTADATLLLSCLQSIGATCDPDGYSRQQACR